MAQDEAGSHKVNRYPREGGGPGVTAMPLLPWIPAFRGNDNTKRWLCFIIG